MRAAEHFVNVRDPKTLTVRQVMEDDVYTASPDTKGIAIAETMTDQNFGAVPVVEKDFTLVGLVSEFDLLRVMEEGKDLRQITAEEIMTRNVVTVTEEMAVTDLIHLLQERHLIRTPVVRGKTLVGIASRRDVVFGYVKATSKYWWPGKGGA
ncbi:MAG: signal transduction protein [Nitrospira sp. WS110]|nr:signal transduction protein [Nitrospira sp. WS110]